MTSAYEGLYIEINGNAVKLESTLSDVRKKLKLLGGELNNFNKQLRFDSGNLDALNGKFENTQKRIKLNEDAAKMLREKLDELAKKGDIGTDQYISLQNQLENTRIEGERLKIELDKVDKAITEAKDPTSIVNLNRALKETKEELKLVDQRLELDPSNVELAARKTELLEKASKLAEQKVEKLKSELKNVDPGDMGESDARKLKLELDKAELEASQLKAEIKGVDDAADKVGKNTGIKTFMTTQVVANLATSALQAVGDKITDLAGEAIAANDSLTKFESTMAFAGYDPTAIESARQAVKDYADQTVYDMQDVANTTAQLAANGIQDYTGLTQAAGNLNAVAGGNAETFKSVGTVMTQTAGAGKLTTENWNQLADAIPGASGVLQEAMLKNGAFTGNFREAMEKGEITAEEFNQAIMEVGTQPIAVEAAKSTETFEGAMGNLEATVVDGINNVIDTVGSETITSAITGLGDVAKTAFDKVSEGIQFVKDNKDVFATMAVGVGAGIAAYAAYGVITAYKTALEGATIAQKLMNLAMKANPIGIVIALVTALVAGLAFFFSQTETGKQVIDGIVGGFHAFIGALQPVITMIQDGWAKAMEAVQPWLQKLWDALKQLEPIFIAIAAVIGGAFAGAFAILAGLFNGFIGAIGGLVQALSGIVTVVSGVVELIIGIFTGDGERIKAAVGQIGQGILDVFGGLWGAVSGFLQGFIDGVIGFFTGLWDTLVGHSIVPDTINGIAEWFQNLIGFVTAPLQAIWNVIVSIFTAVKTWITNVFNAIKSVVITVWNAIKTGISTAINAIKSVVTNIFNAIKSFITGAVNAWKTIITTVWNAIKTAVTTVVNAIKTTVTNIFNTIKNTISGALEGAKSIVQSAWNGIKTFFKTGVDNALGVVKGIKDKIVGFFEGIPDKVWNTIKGIADFGKDLVDGFIGGLQNLGSRVMGIIQNAFNSALDWVKNLPVVGEFFKGAGMSLALQSAGAAPNGIPAIYNAKAMGTIPDYRVKASGGNTTSLSINVTANNADAEGIADVVEKIIVRRLRP